MELLIFCILLAFAEKYSVLDYNLIRALVPLGITMYCWDRFKGR